MCWLLGHVWAFVPTKLSRILVRKGKKYKVSLIETGQKQCLVCWKCAS